MATSKYWIVKNKEYEFVPKTIEGKAPDNVVHLAKPVYLTNGVVAKYVTLYKNKKKISCSRLNFMFQGYIIYKSNIEHKPYYQDKFGQFVNDLNTINNLSSKELVALLLKAQTRAWKKVKKEKKQLEKCIVKLQKNCEKKSKELLNLSEVISLTQKRSVGNC